MSDDHELLELAAKAAGIDGHYEDGATRRGGAAGIYLVSFAEHRTVIWNPLTDDGDALRLAVKLKIPFNFPDWQDIASTWGPKDAFEPINEPALNHNGDLYVATRRAITRAAAEIGKAMPS